MCYVLRTKHHTTCLKARSSRGFMPWALHLKQWASHIVRRLRVLAILDAVHGTVIVVTKRAMPLPRH